ncbi:MAG TPA: APC family permease, partial [Actinomycetota bacterium]|nr:APC family permease [Actinomycetota bacterium]
MNRIFKRLFFGRPVSTHEELHHRLSKKVALAVFSSDALSSSAYATDEILLVLVLAGGLALQYSIGISLAVALVLGVVIASYRQTVRAYPSGGGAYIVTKDGLGTFPGLIAAAAILIDYVLTVSVSVAAGLAAVGAAFPAIHNHRVGASLLIVLFITMLNLRGLKESGTIFAIPTYGFLLSMAVLIGVGVFRVLTNTVAPIPPHAITPEVGLSVLVILKAFSAGCTAMTGVEAISDGVPAFKRPESKNASQTLLTLGLLLGFLFLGITFLARALNVDPIQIEHGKTVTSQIGGQIFGSNSPMFFIIQAFTSLILFLAANTAFADFPRLASILARDRFLPRVLQNRGDKLAFSNGIMVLAAGASVVLIKYGALVHRIIPLYVVGVFTSFTLSQTGMVIHWLKAHKAAGTLGTAEPAHWRRNIAINAFGAFTTFVVLVIIAIAKFTGGAWQVIVLIPAVAWLLYRINGHYRSVERRLKLQPVPRAVAPGKVLILVTRFRGATKALAFVRSLVPDQLKIVAMRTSEVRRLNL